MESAAGDARGRAYCPYSGFAVGAALEAEDGRLFTGCNVECVSYGLTLCAERAAIGAAVSAGARRFRRLVVLTDTDPPATPCGACRQLLAEFGGALEVDCIGRSARRSFTLAELLPVAFDSIGLHPQGGR